MLSRSHTNSHWANAAVCRARSLWHSLLIPDALVVAVAVVDFVGLFGLLSREPVATASYISHSLPCNEPLSYEVGFALNVYVVRSSGKVCCCWRCRCRCRRRRCRCFCCCCCWRCRCFLALLLRLLFLCFVKLTHTFV